MKDNLIFIGTSYLAAQILKKLLDNDYTFQAVITQPDRPCGRKKQLCASPVKEIALAYNLPILQPNKIKNSLEEIKNLKPQLMILVAYGQIIPQAVIDIAPKGIINVHPSLLPKYRGPSPIQTVLLDNKSETGITIMLLDKKMDHGPILNQEKLLIANDDNETSLTTKIIDKGSELLAKTIPQWLNNELKPQEQDHSQATFCQMLTKSDGHINWQQPVSKIAAQIKAFYEWPRSYSYIKQKGQLKNLVIEQAIISNIKSELKPGTLILKDKLLYISTSDYLLQILKLQPEGKKIMEAEEYLRGYRHHIDKILE